MFCLSCIRSKKLVYSQIIAQTAGLIIGQHMCLIIIYGVLNSRATSSVGSPGTEITSGTSFPRIRLRNPTVINRLNSNSVISTSEYLSSEISPDTLINRTTTSSTFDCQQTPGRNYLQYGWHRKQGPCFLGNVDTVLTVEENSPILLRCFVYNVNFSTVVISWWREGHMRELTLGLEVTSPNYQLPRTTYQDWSLRILQTRPEDSGVYVCQINLEQTIEKIFHLHVKRKPMSATNSPISEHEFVKDEAIQNLPTPKLSIDGYNEGHVGSAISLKCVAYFKTVSSNNHYLVWLHKIGSQFVYITPSSEVEKLTFLLHNVDLDLEGRGGDHHPLIRSTSAHNVKIDNREFSNGTYHSALTLQPLLVEHAGLWRCLKFSYPNQEGQVETIDKMVYVRTKKSFTREHKSANGRHQTNIGTSEFNRTKSIFEFLILLLPLFITICV
ncbi:Defective proboscis extension response (Dpr) [Paragonimus heterotremus]|uniref:Defective proboscis extension response (Dpr) n=1 Tax=Paragonimus heterotremus TaxID=100268 RepID=A0A8J4SUP8_9TREM|nr:Defective proboscis extension response (Dpr) [Paragonimus heterotremus]